MPMPDCVWELDPPEIVASQHGNHQGFVLNVAFHPAAGSHTPLSHVTMILPIKDGDNAHEIFFSALLHANQEHAGSNLLRLPGNTLS